MMQYNAMAGHAMGWDRMLCYVIDVIDVCMYVCVSVCMYVM